MCSPGSFSPLFSCVLSLILFDNSMLVYFTSTTLISLSISNLKYALIFIIKIQLDQSIVCRISICQSVKFFYLDLNANDKNRSIFGLFFSTCHRIRMDISCPLRPYSNILLMKSTQNSLCYLWPCYQRFVQSILQLRKSIVRVSTFNNNHSINLLEFVLGQRVRIRNDNDRSKQVQQKK